MKHSEVIKLVNQRAKEKGYKAYEVDDVLDSYFFVLTKLLAAGESVVIPYVGSIGSTARKARIFKCNLTGQYLQSKANPKFTFTPTRSIKEHRIAELNPGYSSALESSEASETSND